MNIVKVDIVHASPAEEIVNDMPTSLLNYCYNLQAFILA
jgi:hypothetical protein